MIDLSLLREHTKSTVARIKKKDPTFPAEELCELEQKKRGLQNEVESLRQKKNQLAHEGKKGVTPALRERSIALGKELKIKEQECNELMQKFEQLYLACPNVVFDDVPAGGKESNKEVARWGESTKKAEKTHLDIGLQAGWFDLEVAATVTGSNFVVYKEPAVKLIYALTMFMLKHNREHGFEMMLPPYLVNERSLEIAGNFPKFKEDVYAIAGANAYLIPTAEVALANLYRDHIFASEDLPKRYTSWTSCFRREAGGYGAQDRGLMRIHQFEKVELFSYCLPEHGEFEQRRMMECAESILQKLELPYRVMLLAAEDTSFQSAKTYDIELWIPSQNGYVEVSSTSNCTDFQARRGAIRYRAPGEKNTHFVYTLNGSSLALPRLMVAIMEHYVQEDGTIAWPHVLNGYGV